jgi:hypothetical protein
MDPCVCGTYLVIDSANACTAKDLVCHIPLKIPIDRFLILKNVKYLLSWMGKWELRLYFDPAALVVMPIDPTSLINQPRAQVLWPKLSSCVFATATRPPTQDFTQIGDPFTGYSVSSISTAGALTLTTTAVGGETFTASRFVSNGVETNLATFQLRADVVEELKAKYLERPLTFPVNFFIINRFAGIPKLDALSHVLSTTINNCDTMFMLVPNTTNSNTCFYNPFIKKFQLDAGPYGCYPSQPMDTYNDRRFVNMTGDALNVNNSVLTSFNKDVNSSFCITAHFTTVTTNSDPGKQTTTNAFSDQTSIGDRSNFFISVPFSVDNDYQGGLSSPSSSIVFKCCGMALETDGHTIPRHTPAMAGWNQNWYALFLIDGSLMVKPDVTGESARVIYSDRSIV